MIARYTHRIGRFRTDLRDSVMQLDWSVARAWLGWLPSRPGKLKLFTGVGAIRHLPVNASFFLSSTPFFAADSFPRSPTIFLPSAPIT